VEESLGFRVASDSDRGRQDFATWIQPHVAKMAWLARRLAPSSDSDDIVQEAAVRAWQKRAQFDPERGSPSAWLLAITADQARKANRRRRPTSHLFGVTSTVHDADEKVDLDYAISRLPTRQRVAIECFYFVGLSITETSAVMGCAEGTVKSTLADARHRLRVYLGSPE
jgi:RNA polymerase sigma-70 factor, ECF subfamily